MCCLCLSCVCLRCLDVPASLCWFLIPGFVFVSHSRWTRVMLSASMVFDCAWAVVFTCCSLVSDLRARPSFFLLFPYCGWPPLLSVPCWSSFSPLSLSLFTWCCVFGLMHSRVYASASAVMIPCCVLLAPVPTSVSEFHISSFVIAHEHSHSGTSGTTHPSQARKHKNTRASFLQFLPGPAHDGNPVWLPFTSAPARQGTRPMFRTS
jgi:hypothetical protein